MKFCTIPYIFCLLIIVSCSNNAEKNDENDSLYGNTSSTSGNVKLKLPSPVELYLFIREAKVEFKQEALNPTNKSGNYITRDEKALNFGIYASDLAYCTVFEKQQETHNYFKVLKSYAGELGVTEGYDKKIIARIDDNLYNSDSLYQITNDSYWKVCNYLEENGKADILAPILFGGWIESLYLATQSVETFDQTNPIVIRITEQRYLLENLIEYVNSMKKNKETEMYLSKLNALQDIFDQLYNNSNNTLITKEQYKAIVQKVKSIRADFVK